MYERIARLAKEGFPVDIRQVSAISEKPKEEIVKILGKGFYLDGNILKWKNVNSKEELIKMINDMEDKEADEFLTSIAEFKEFKLIHDSIFGLINKI
jgi:hypothetical protein